MAATYNVTKVRLRCKPTGAVPAYQRIHEFAFFENYSHNTFFYQRIAAPDENSDYAAYTWWTGWGYRVAVASFGANVWVFRAGYTAGKLYRRESTDYGATFPAGWINMGDISGGNISYQNIRLAAAAKSETEAIVIYSNNTNLYRRRLSGGVWEAEAAWSNSLDSVSGLACVYNGDWNVVVTGIEDTTLKPGVWTCLLGDGYSKPADSWSTLQELLLSEADANIEYKFPSVAIPDVYRIFFIEKYRGSEAYSRPYWTHAPPSAEWASNLWREPIPFNLASEYGLSFVWTVSNVWLSRTDGIWRAPYSAANVDISADVVEIKAKTTDDRGSIALSLRNGDGRFNSIGASGDTYEALTLGAEVRFSPGLVTTAAGSPEHSVGLRYYIDELTYISGPPARPQAQLLIGAVDGWGLLARWRARRQYVWLAGDKTVYQLIAFIVARAGFDFANVGGASTAANDLLPAFVINPGESGRTAVLKLLAMIPDVLFFRGQTAYTKDPKSADASDYTYGADHDVLDARYGSVVPSSNRAQVIGDGIFTEDFEWPSISLVFDIVDQDIDMTLDTTTRGHTRGATRLRQADIESNTGYILVPMNCGQEMYDVITITDKRAPITTAKRRVLGLEHTYLPAKGDYTLRLTLGAP